MAARILTLVALCAILCQNCLAIPAVVPLVNKRVQRSPQFGFPEEGFVAPEYQAPGSILQPPVFPIQEPLPVALPGAYPPYGVYPESGGAGNSFASANAGSFGNDGGPSEAQSQANSQTATINFGPLSASFSNSESSAESSNF